MNNTLNKTFSNKEDTMKQVVRLIVMSIIVGVVLWFAGCTEETKSPVAPSAPSTEINTIQPKGFITGKIVDRCTGMAINGALISLGYGDTVHSVFSDASGSFAFANVPAGEYKVCPTCSVWTGTYTITASLVNYNAQQTDPARRYRDYIYNTVTIGFTSLIPGDSLGVSGLVGSVVCTLATLSTTLRGTVVNQDLQPVANASVLILDHFTTIVLAQTTSGSDGSFQVPYLENGSLFEVRAKSADGSLEAWTVKGIPCNQSADSIRAQVEVEQLVLAPVDDVPPFIISVSPSNKADVAVGTPIVYTFSEPIKQTPFTRTDLGMGHGTIVDYIHVNFVSLKKTSAETPLPAFTWNAAFTQLTITPSGLTGSAKYTVSIDTVTIKANLTDIAGNNLVNNLRLTGDIEGLEFTTAGGAAGPAAPVLARRTVQNFVGPLDYNGGVVGLEWNSVNGARSYNIYRSVGNGPFDLARADVRMIQDTISYGPLVIPSSVNPLGPLSIRYQVRSVGADLVEGAASNIITISDEVTPDLLSVNVAAGTGASPLLWWRYTLRFSEPLTVSNAQTVANYSILNPDTVTFAITKADYLGYDAGLARYLVQLLISSNLAAPAGYSIRALSGITDLAGNAMDATANTVTFSAPPAPVLVSPPDALAPTIGLPAVLTWAATNGAVTYRLQVSTVGGGGFAGGLVFDSNNLTNPLASTSYGVSSTYLTAGVTYFWRVYAVNAAGTSTASAIRQFVP
jgi:hypothetical protein